MSLTKMSRALLTSSVPCTIRPPRSSSMNDAAAPPRRTSQAAAASSCMASARARASAAAAMWTPHSSWLTSLTFCPSPGATPTWGAERAMTSSSGWTRWTASSLPPTMISRSPLPARAAPPETGASTRSTCWRPSRSAHRWTGPGPTVAITTTVAPGASAAAAGSSPKSTPSACSGVATMTTRTSAPVAASPMPAAGRTPSPARDVARPGSMSYAVTSYPARAAHPAIGCPIAPSPTQPTRLISRPSSPDRRRTPLRSARPTSRPPLRPSRRSPCAAARVCRRPRPGTPRPTPTGTPCAGPRLVLPCTPPGRTPGCRRWMRARPGRRRGRPERVPVPGRASRPAAEQVDHVGEGGLVADIAGEHDVRGADDLGECLDRLEHRHQAGQELAEDGRTPDAEAADGDVVGGDAALGDDPGGLGRHGAADDLDDGRGHLPGDLETGGGVGVAQQGPAGEQQHVRLAEGGNHLGGDVGDVPRTAGRVGDSRDVELDLGEPAALAGDRHLPAGEADVGAGDDEPVPGGPPAGPDVLRLQRRLRVQPCQGLRRRGAGPVQEALAARL